MKEIVEKAYKRNKKPVHYNFILSALCRIRKVYNPSSIQSAIYGNQFIRRVNKKFFVPISESSGNCESYEDSIDKAPREFEKGLFKETK